MSKESEIVNVRLPEELILELDKLVEKKLFKSRSEAIREFARQYVQEHSTKEHSSTESQNAKKSGRGGGAW